MQRSHYFHSRGQYFLLSILISILTLVLAGAGVKAAPAVTDCAAQTDIPQAECEALVALYNSTDGPNWLDNTGWNETNAPCDWYGVSCYLGRVRDLSLSANQLSGPLPDLSALSGLQYLYFADNQLTGTIPDVSALTGLQILDLGQNQLEGSIPPLSTLTNLRNLYLDGNQLTNSIPDLSALTLLQFLHLNDNQLSGSIPELATLTNLQSMRMNNNQLTGPIPALAALTNLQLVFLNNNHLDGAIPAVNTLTLLQFMWLDNNRLSGPIPDLTALTNLRNFEVENNQLNGVVPASICQVQTVVDLDYNRLEVDTADPCVDVKVPNWKNTQTVPPTNVAAAVASATDVQVTWDVITYTQDGGYYGVWGKVQGELLYTLLMTTTDKLSTSAVVSGLQSGTTYEFVVRTFTPAHDAQQNDLTSVDSAVVTAVTPITNTNCAVQTDIPQAECETLLALYNDTDGFNWQTHTGWNVNNTPCNWYGITCSGGNVQQVSLSDNRLSGAIPSLSTLTRLQTLDLTLNQLTGSIPSLSALTNLQHLQLADNELTGAIPNLATLTNLRTLSLSNNKLNGGIPSLATLTNLQHLLLTNNYLSGTIPTLAALTNLQTLHLDRNLLDGAIPELTALTQLQSLALSQNELDGAVPALAALPQLETIELFDNQLSGPIPDLSAQTNLQSLNLAYNQLEGSVPASVCQAATTVDLGYNKLEVDTAVPCVDIADPDWKDTQTVPPTNVTGIGTSTTDIQLTWDAIAYTQDGGYYEIWGKLLSEPTYSRLTTTASKTVTTTVVSDLLPAMTYEFVIRTFTPAHDDQQNDLTSVNSVKATTQTEGFWVYLSVIIND